jgi:hypothetical protein
MRIISFCHCCARFRELVANPPDVFGTEIVAAIARGDKPMRDSGRRVE